MSEVQALGVGRDQEADKSDTENIEPARMISETHDDDEIIFTKVYGYKLRE